MNQARPGIPKGTRDFGPEIVAKRSIILSTIRAIFKKYGFQPLETPAMENLEVLMGKYGQEGDQLLFKILNSGNFLAKVDQDLTQADPRQLLPKIAEKGLRYDLTVPFARYVATHYYELAMPFRRYQIQPVWRADRPQKGRYREFLQCDADVIGTSSLACEAEILLMIQEVMDSLGIDGFEIAINNRKLLSGLSEYLGFPEKETPLCIAIDKLEKIGMEGVTNELVKTGFTEESIRMLLPYLEMKGGYQEKLDQLEMLLGNEKSKAGYDELNKVLHHVETMSGNQSSIVFDQNLARGLSYYTGFILEVRIVDGTIGSVCGGGRYDDLTGIFGLRGVSGVGISFGIDRLFDVMEQMSLFDKQTSSFTRVLVTHMGDKAFREALSITTKLRAKDIPSEIYPDQSKLKKQLSYANKNHIPWVITIGEDELKAGLFTLKEMASGVSRQLNKEEMFDFIQHIP